MASIVTKRKGKKTYYFLRENRWVDGRSKMAWQMYIGTADKLKEILDQKKKGVELLDVQSKKYGDVAAALSIIRRLGLIGTVDQHAPKRNSGAPSVGEYTALMVINRCSEPTSKRRMAEWYKDTALGFLFPTATKSLSSQAFWNHMCYLSDEAIEAVEREIARTLVDDFGVSTERLLFDATNFHTYIEDHSDNTIPRRGASKAKRFELRQVNLALLVTLEFGLPLHHATYPGNINDPDHFKGAISALVERIREVSRDVKDVTIVFDKGNNSKPALDDISEGGLHFVGSLRPSSHPDLAALDIGKFEEKFESASGATAHAHRTARTVYGQKRTVVVTHNPQLRKRALKDLEGRLAKRLGELEELKGKLNTGKWRDPDAVRAKVQKVVPRKKDKKLIRWTVGGGVGSVTLDFGIDGEAYRDRVARLGRTILFTDQDGWTTKEIVLAYRTKHVVEDDFRQLKCPHVVEFTPMFHWTDQKIKVHGFICVMALLVCNLIRRQLHLAKIKMSARDAISNLANICLVRYKVAGELKFGQKLANATGVRAKMLTALGIEDPIKVKWGDRK